MCKSTPVLKCLAAEAESRESNKREEGARGKAREMGKKEREKEQDT